MSLVIEAADLFAGSGGTSVGLIQAVEALGGVVNLVAVNQQLCGSPPLSDGAPKQVHDQAVQAPILFLRPLRQVGVNVRGQAQQCANDISHKASVRHLDTTPLLRWYNDTTLVSEWCPMNPALDPLQVAWAAGLIEGEGSIQLTEGRYSAHIERRTVASRIRVVMTDRDVVERIRDVFGVGKILLYRNTQGLGKKQLYRWDTSRRDEVKAICAAIYPFMGERRKQQIDRVLAALEANPPASNADRVRRGWATIKARTAS